MSLSLVYMTAGSPEEADVLARMLVERRLAACANVIDGMRSVYWWEGTIEEGREAMLVAKTRTDLVDELTRAVKAIHSYEVPCVVAVPLEGGNPDFLNWIYDETKRPKRGD